MSNGDVTASNVDVELTSARVVEDVADVWHG